jgi:hypothetical protein
MTKYVIISIVFLVLILINACSPTSFFYPYPSNLLSPYPGIHVETPSSIIVPTPSSGTGTITGYIVNTTSPGSIVGLTLYLANLLPLTPGPEHFITVNLEHSPRAIVHADGRFIFSDVVPGRYALVLWLPHDSRLITDPNNPEFELIVTAIAGEVTDLGTLKISSLR